MSNQSTKDKLIEMRLSAMADAFWNQLQDPRYKDMDVADQFAILVDIEYNTRKSNRLRRLIKGASFDQPTASIMDINYTSGRKLNKELIDRLATCIIEIPGECKNEKVRYLIGCFNRFV